MLSLKEAYEKLNQFQEVFRLYEQIPPDKLTPKQTENKKTAERDVHKLKIFIALKDAWFFIKEFVYTKDEHDKENPFKRFITPDAPEGSYLYLKEIVKLWEKESLLAIHKTRQLRISWLFMALYVWDCLAFEGRLNMVQTKREDDAEELIRRAKIIVERLPKEMVGRYEPTFCNIEFMSKKSTLRGLPQGVDVIRSNTPSNLFLDEGCFQDDLKLGYESARPCAKKIAIASSSYYARPTPSASFFRDLLDDIYGNDFTSDTVLSGPLPEYQNVEAYRNKNGFIRIIADQRRIPWRYFEDRLVSREEWLKLEQPGYTKKSWAVEQERSWMAGATGQKFEQETIDRLIKEATPPIYKGFLNWNINKIGFINAGNGQLSIWELPIKEKRNKNGHLLQEAGQYVIGADVGAGLSSEGDCSTAAVMDKRTKKIIAVWQGHKWPQVFARELYLLGRFYNDAYLIAESNSYGILTLTALWQGMEKYEQPPYPNLYKDKTFGTDSDRETPRLGFFTSNSPGSRKKLLLIETFVQAVRDKEYTVPAREIIDEMQNYTEFEDGTLGASRGNDDLVIASALAWHGLLDLPYKEEPVITSKSYGLFNEDWAETEQFAGSTITGY